MTEMSTTVSVPGSYPLKNVGAVAQGLRELGWTVNDPDCWVWPSESPTGYWVLHIWR